MPWHIAVDHPSCTAGDRFAVVKDMDGAVEGCHPSRDAAEAQLAALYAAEQEATAMTREAFDDITRQVFVPDTEAFHLPGKHNQKDHGSSAGPKYDRSKPKGMTPKGHTPKLGKSPNVAEATAPDWLEQISEQVFGPPTPASAEAKMPEMADLLPAQTQTAGGKPSKGTPADKRLKRNRTRPAYAAEPDAPVAVSGPVGWEGTMVVEGISTGDGRRFAAGSLRWPDPANTPIDLEWQKETSHGGDTDKTVKVGLVTEITRGSDGHILGRGIIDTGNADGAEIARQLQGEGRLGVSIVADDPDREEVEFVYADDCPPDGPSLENILTGDVPDRCLQADEVIFHSGRIRSLTIVNTPAFVEAQIHPADLIPEPVVAAIVLAAVAAHSTATYSDPWDAAANETRLPSPLPVGVAEQAYAWLDRDAVDDGDIPKSSAKFLHHTISADGAVGAANTGAASAGIGALHGARGGTTIPEADRRGVYNHLARHLRDAGLEPPPFDLIDAVEMLTSAASAIDAPELPPAGWFTEPGRIPDIGAIEITDEGRIFGLLAPANVAHRGYPDRRITVPMGNVDYSRWACRTTICAGGTRVATGPITMECGHAGLGASTASAADHYDNSCSIVASCSIGENRHGVWIAGALMPDLPAGRVARILACQLSGDWRPHRDRPGMREFVAALLVPVPGFPFAGARRSVTMTAATGLTAAAVPVHYRPEPAPVSPGPAGPDPGQKITFDDLVRLVHGDDDGDDK